MAPPLFSPPLALRLNAGFVPVRKAKKLPGDCHKVTYTLEYGEDAFEIQKDSIKEGQTVLIVDDLIATGGSASAAGKLVKMAGGKTVEYLFVVGLPFLNGDKKLDAPAYCQSSPPLLDLPRPVLISLSPCRCLLLSSLQGSLPARTRASTNPGRYTPPLFLSPVFIPLPRLERCAAQTTPRHEQLDTWFLCCTHYPRDQT